MYFVVIYKFQSIDPILNSSTQNLSLYFSVLCVLRESRWRRMIVMSGNPADQSTHVKRLFIPSDKVPKQFPQI